MGEEVLKEFVIEGIFLILCLGILLVVVLLILIFFVVLVFDVRKKEKKKKSEEDCKVCKEWKWW